MSKSKKPTQFHKKVHFQSQVIIPTYWVDALLNIREELVAAERGENHAPQGPALARAANHSSDAPRLPSVHPVVTTNPLSTPVSTNTASTRRWSPAALVLRFGQAIKHLIVVIVVLGIALLAASFLAAYRRIAAQTT
jgi:hypothetical protein